MNSFRLIAPLLLAAPALAQAAPHLLIVRVTDGQTVYERTLNAETGAQTSGPVNGLKMVVNATFKADGHIQYQLDLSGPASSFQVQSSVTVLPGRSLRAIDCGNWKVDLAFDAAKDAVPAATAMGDNVSLKAFANRKTCKVIKTDSSQSNIGDSAKTGARKSGFFLNVVVTKIPRGRAKVEYELESGNVKGQGEQLLTIGKKTRAKTGKIDLLVEQGGTASAARAPAKRDEGGPIPLLR